MSRYDLTDFEWRVIAPLLPNTPRGVPRVDDRRVLNTIVLADKAYDADRIRQLIQDHGATPNIPPKSNRRWKPCFSRRLYRERNLIERFFSKLKHFRRVATRYDKLAANFLAMVQLASMRLWMRANEPTG
jgi:transposase